jgi:5-methylcytosine-specific restriction protein A
MSTKRRAGATFLGKGPNGRNLCFCGCGREVVRPRLNWFSDACVHAWKLINDPATIAAAVLERDRGICALCNLDTVTLRNSCLPHGCNVPPPDPFAIAAEMGYKNEYAPDRIHSWKVRPDVEAAYEVAHFIWVREVEIAWRAAQEDRLKECAAMGFTDASRRWWEADHIVPVVEGGGQCGLEGYRTLCLPCHRKVTAALARRRAERRRMAKQPELEIHIEKGAA